MLDLSTHPIGQPWPTTHPDVLQLYSFPTSNGVKVSITLEELGLPYEVHSIDVTRGETWTPQSLTLNPNGKIPAIIDPNGPDGTPTASGHGQRYGHRRGRQCLQWRSSRITTIIRAQAPKDAKASRYHRPMDLSPAFRSNRNV